MIHKRFIRVAATFLLSSAGCSTYQDVDPPDIVAIVAETPTPQTGQLPDDIQAALDAQPPPKQPIRIAIALDLTGSREQHRVQPPQLSDLQRLIALVREQGGDIAVLPVCDDSNRPMHRLRLTATPRLNENQFERVAPPLPPDEGTNSFYLADVNAEYQKQREAYDQIQAHNQQILEAYKQALATWESETQARIDAFLEEVKPLLEAEPTCPETDVQGARQRLDVFFLEDPAAFSAPPRNFAIFVSDGIDTVNHPLVEMRSDTEILLVNGSGSTGVLTGTDYKMFESPAAAFDYIFATIQHQGGKP